MIEIPDHIYLRSVIKQLYLKEESRHLFQKNAYSVSIHRGKSEFSTEATEVFTFKNEMILAKQSLNGILRKILCAGGSLTELKAEVIFAGGFEEERLREFVASLKRVADELGAEITRVAVYLKESSETEKMAVISGNGPLKKPSDASWQRQRIFEGQDIILTGSIGKAGALDLFNKNEEELISVYPKIFIEKIRHRTADRLPLAETETASFYKTTALLPLENGGLLAGLWNLGEREEAGLRIYADTLRYEQFVIELSNHFNVNPLELNSKGAYLLVTERGEELTQALRTAGVEAVCIGKVTKDKKRIIVFEDEERFIETPKYVLFK